MAGRILVIEDSATFRALLTATLRRKGYEVISAETGAAGIREAMKQMPNVITLDLSLPDMSGVEVLSALKADPSTCQVPVIICTASVDGNLRQEVLQKGAAEILTKPVQPTDLFAALNRHLRHSSDHVRATQAKPLVASQSPLPNAPLGRAPDALFEVWSGLSDRS